MKARLRYASVCTSESRGRERHWSKQGQQGSWARKAATRLLADSATIQEKPPVTPTISLPAPTSTAHKPLDCALPPPHLWDLAFLASQGSDAAKPRAKLNTLLSDLQAASI